jgi:hypothetical protein
MVQDFYWVHGVLVCVIMVELNQHHNNKGRTHDWDMTHFTEITQFAIWIGVS